MKFDLHIHSNYSSDGREKIEDIIRIAVKKGLEGIAVADHNTVEGAKKALECAAGMKNFVVVPAAEISTVEGHLLQYGILKDIPSNLSAAETADLIHAEGGIVVVPHLYRLGTGIGKKFPAEFQFDAIEVMNNRCFEWDNKKALRVAKKLNTGVTGGSDAHHLFEIGSCITVTNDTVSNYDDLLELISRRRTTAYGVSKNPAEFVLQKLRGAYKWAKRGFKRI